MVSSIAFIVTCKGRLHHLRHTLPRLVGRPGTECIVVDYDCPDRTGAWVEDNFPAVRIVRVGNAPYFNLARARNLGAAAASAAWLCFVDADVFLDEAFVAAVGPVLKEGCYYRPQPIIDGTNGTYLCRRSDFQLIEGYDEAMEGWGAEDFDLYCRLEALGRRQTFFSSALVDAIQHDNAARMQHYEMPDMWLNHRINRLYLQVKYDIYRQVGALPLAMRRALYDDVRSSLTADVARGANAHRFVVTLGDSLNLPNWSIKRSLVYELEPKSD